MQQVKQMIEGGVSASTAIKEAIGTSVTSFADRNGLSRIYTSEILNLVRAPDAATCEALGTELGGEPFEWALFLWEYAKPDADRFAAALASRSAAGA